MDTPKRFTKEEIKQIQEVVQKALNEKFNNNSSNYTSSAYGIPTTPSMCTCRACPIHGMMSPSFHWGSA